MSKMKKLNCPYCDKEAERVGGIKIYPHRPDLKGLVFYQCTPCNAYVGTHKGTNKPLGTLADKSLRIHRSLAHDNFDHLWKNGPVKRKTVYLKLSEFMGIPFNNTHIAMFNIEQCKKVVEFSTFQ